MFGKSLIAVILLVSLTACNSQNETPKENNTENTSSTFASDAEKVIKNNVESIEENYKQQADDSAPAEKVD